MHVRLRKERGGRGSLPVGTTREIQVADLGGEQEAKIRARAIFAAAGHGDENPLDWEATIFDPADQARYRIVDEFPYLEREDEYADLTLDEAAVRMEDLCPIDASTIHAEAGDEEILPWEWKDDETGRTVTLTRDIEKDVPEAGAMSKGDGLGGPPPAKGQGEVFAETDPDNWPSGRPTFGAGR